jgi:hypothetical protein
MFIDIWATQAYLADELSILQKRTVRGTASLKQTHTCLRKFYKPKNTNPHPLFKKQLYM